MKVDIVTSDDIKIYYTGRFQDFTAKYIIKSLFTLQDDQRVCLAYGVITKDMDMVCPVDATGKFTAQVVDFAGQYIKVIRIYQPRQYLSQLVHFIPNKNLSDCRNLPN